ncbi:hypothetical protein HD554DRAFT_801322 [Boletus coccyginus]|nr:hypothetical protein HD554DRAFT_801322 [Boletus coccyginus]
MSEGMTTSPETVSVFLIAFILTSFRLWFRYHIRRLWWDDFWAVITFICDAVCMATAWTLTAPLDNPYINIESLPTPALSRYAHVVSFWLSILFYTCSIWFARLSIAFSMVRIVPPARSVSMTVFGAGGVFACMWAYILACKSVVCAMDTSWYDTLPIGCPMPNWVALSEVLTDVLSDVILVALPFGLLWRVKLPSNQRIMILSVFSASILVSVVSVVHTVYLVRSVTFISGITAQMEAAISLIVCNLLVIVTFVYRVIRNGRDLTAGLSGKNTGSSCRLTTVDLDLTGGSLLSRTTTTGTRTGSYGTAFTGTEFTGTDVSSLKFANMTKETTFGSILSTGVSVLPIVTVSTDGSPLPVTTKQ